MLNIHARAFVTRTLVPVGGLLARGGVSANLVTVVGTVGVVAVSVGLLATGRLVWGAVLVGLFALFDLLDGAVARAHGGGSPFGMVLDATCDRIADGAVFAALAWWGLTTGDRPVAVAALVCLVAAQVISYVKARAEASGLDADGGWMERAERCVIALVCAFLQGVGVPHALVIGLTVLAVLSAVTVGQRLVAAHGSRDTS